MRRELYPENWRDISLRIREREGNKCKWCGIPNGAHIHRLRVKPFEWILDEDYKQLGFFEAMDYTGVSKIVLTCAHLDHGTTNNDDSNLAALCNRCHLNHDAQYHATNARRTRLTKKRQAIAETGQQELWT